MGDYEQIVPFAFELEDDGFETNSQIMVGLPKLANQPKHS
jgi:hypothetical protein